MKKVATTTCEECGATTFDDAREDCDLNRLCRGCYFKHAAVCEECS